MGSPEDKKQLRRYCENCKQVTDWEDGLNIETGEFSEWCTWCTERIPERWVKIANLPVKHLHWYSSSGEEYQWTGDAEYVVLNTKLGNSRMRQICKILTTVVINPEGE